MRIIGSTWTGKYTSGKTTYQRKFSAFAEYEVTETPTTITYTVSELGIQKVGGGTAQMVTGETKRVSFQIVEGTTVLGSVGVTGYTTLMKFESADPYPISIASGSFTINKTASDRAVKLVLSASKDSGAWSGTSTLEEEVIIPAWSKPTVQFTVTRSETTATNASVTATVTSFVGDTISNFKLTYGGKTTTLTGGTIPASGTITRTTTISGLATGAVECSLVATGTGGTSATVTRVIPSAFYTLEIGEEGKEIAFGASATGDTVPANGLFKCLMDVMLKDGMLIDYPIERGTNNGWDYTKYASGYVTLTRFVSKTAMKLSNSTSGTYYDSSETSDRTTLAVPLVSTIKSVMTQDAINGTSHSSGVYVYEVQVSGTNITVKFRAHASLSNASGGAFVEVKGVI